MTFWVDHITGNIKGGVAVVTHLVPFSVAEWVLLAAVLVPLWLLIREIRRMRRRGRERITVGHGLYRIGAGLLAILLTYWGAFSLFYGANFYADGFQERAGIFAEAVTVEELERVTAYFAAGLNETAHLVPRDENGVFDASIQTIFDESVDVFRNLEAYFPFLTHRDRRPKPLLTSPLWAMTDYTGFFFPFTAEANINILAPRSQVPATVLHEFVHQRGFASENEANFVAILAGVKGDNPIFAYSAYLLGYSHLAAALGRVAPERFQAIHGTLVEYVHADLADIRAYHDRKNPMAQRITNAANDGMLRSYGEVSGILSYGEVVDLLVVYF